MTQQQPNDPVAQRLARVEQSIVMMDKSISRVADMVERLTRMEERNVSIANSLEKVWQKVDALSIRVVELEKSEPMQAQTTKWVTGAMWGALGAAGMFILKKLGVA